jgi:hypothetical protein
MRHRSSWLLALATAAALNTPAHAQQTAQGRAAACVWASAPADTRAKLIAAAPSTRQMNAALSDALTQQTAKACGIAPTQDGAQLIAYALMSNAMALGAEAKLETGYGIDRPRLAAAWDRVPAYARLSLSTVMRPPRRLTPGTMASLRATAGALDLRDPRAVELLFTYMVGRAIRERLARDDLASWWRRPGAHPLGPLHGADG